MQSELFVSRMTSCNTFYWQATAKHHTEPHHLGRMQPVYSLNWLHACQGNQAASGQLLDVLSLVQSSV